MPLFQASFTALAAAVAITALAFMAGELFSNSGIKAFAKLELSELFVTLLIILAALALSTPGGIFDIVSQGFMLQGVPVDSNHVCPEWAAAHGTYVPATDSWTHGNRAFAQADFFLGCRPTLSVPSSANPFGITVGGVMLKKLTLGYSSLMVTEMFIGFLSGLSTNFAVPILFPLLKLDVGMTPWIAMAPLNDVHTLLVDLIGASWAGFAGQKILLVFIEEAALSVFLPFGVLLRAFPFSRKAGSTIIAVVFAAYFVYPTSILINQQIWEMISNPQPQLGGPTCLTNDQPCTFDDDCCSLDCRYKPALGTNACSSPLTDFTEYKSIYSICADAYINHNDQLNAILQTQAADNDEHLLDIYFKGSASSDKWTKTEQMMYDALGELKRKAGIITGTSTTPGIATKIWFPTPKQSTIAIFKEVEVLVMDAAQFSVLTVLFLVNEIIITMTLMKDFALLIGGEPRVLGITKLV